MSDSTDTAAAAAGSSVKKAGPKVCVIEDCGKKQKARGWCDKHYFRFRVHGSPHITLVRERTGQRSCAKCLRTPEVVPFRRDKRAPDGLGAYCLPCGREANRAISEETRTEYRANERGKYAADPQRRLAANRAWRTANRDVQLPRRRARAKETLAWRSPAKKAWNLRNQERVRTYYAEWRACNPDRERANGRAWRARNADRIAAYSAQRRLRMYGLDGAIELINRYSVWLRDKGICGLCAHPVPFKRMHLDHVKPLVKGGAHTFSNVQPTHARCNRRKRDREVPKWGFAAITLPAPRGPLRAEVLSLF